MKGMPCANATLLILISWLIMASMPLVIEASDANRTLSERIEGVIIEEPLTAEGATPDHQFFDVLQKISDRYSERWKHPLPIRIDFDAIHQLRSSTKNLNAFMGLDLRDVPLSEALRGWCTRANLIFNIADGAVQITIKPNPTNGKNAR